jgi:hypothetical protein
MTVLPSTRLVNVRAAWAGSMRKSTAIAKKVAFMIVFLD